MVKAARHQANERGAAVLIVMLAVTVLTAVGVFAAHRSAMVTSASGYDRQAQQTKHLAEYAGRLTASELSEGRASEYLRIATSGTTADTCEANSRAVRAAGVPTRLPCYVITPQDLTARLASQGLQSSLLDDPTNDASGSLTPPNGSPLEGIMRVELLDVQTLLGMPGSDVSANSPFRPVEVVINTWAQVRAIAPTGSTENPTSWTGQTAFAGSTSVQALRARFSVPNVSLTINRAGP